MDSSTPPTGQSWEKWAAGDRTNYSESAAERSIHSESSNHASGYSMSH